MRILFKLLLLMVLWGVGGGLLYVSHRSTCANGTVIDYPIQFDLAGSERTISNVHLVQYVPGQNREVQFSMRFSSMGIENGRLGLFRTAMLKQVSINDLAITHRIKPVEADADKTSKAGEAAELLELELLNDQPFLNVLLDGVDLSNTNSIIINNLSCQLIDSEDVPLRIEARRARAEYGLQGVMMEGHVELVYQGTRIRSNRVFWNMKDKMFEIDGMYAIRRDEQSDLGKAACLTYQLVPVHDVVASHM